MKEDQNKRISITRIEFYLILFILLGIALNLMEIRKEIRNIDVSTAIDYKENKIINQSFDNVEDFCKTLIPDLKLISSSDFRYMENWNGNVWCRHEFYILNSFSVSELEILNVTIKKRIWY